MSTLQWEYNLVERSCCGQLNAIDWQWLEGATSVLELIALRPRSGDRPLYALRGGLSGAGANSTDSSIAANIERGF